MHLTTILLAAVLLAWSPAVAAPDADGMPAVEVPPPLPAPRHETVPPPRASDEAQIWHPGEYGWTGRTYSWNPGYWMPEGELPPRGPDTPAGKRLFRQGHWESSGPGTGTFRWVPPGWL